MYLILAVLNERILTTSRDLLLWFDTVIMFQGCCVSLCIIVGAVVFVGRSICMVNIGSNY